MTIGTHVRAQDWEARTGGTSIFTPDVSLDGMLFARIVRSPHPRALIRSIDTTRARALPGVVDVITSADIRPTRYMHMGTGDEGTNSDRYPLARGQVRFVGEEVAVVVAETEETARRAAALVRVDYKVQSPVLTVDQALAPGAQAVHESVADNVAARTDVLVGDVAAGRRAAAKSVTATYDFNQQTHACMETNGITVWFDAAEKLLHVWAPTQSPYFVRKEIAHQLELAPSQVIFHEVAIGGGFGSKSKISDHEVCAALLAVRTGRPVRLILDRSEEFATTKPRHRFRMQLETGATADGKLTHRIGEVVVDNGAYNHFGPAVMGYGVGVMASMYRVETQKIDGRLVYTNNQPGGQFRGYGGVQAMFAVECQMDELADALGIDPMDIRLRNANQTGDVTPLGWEITQTRLTECIETLRRETDWDRKRATLGPGYGIGMSCAMHVTGAMFLDGANRSGAGVDVFADGRVAVRFGGADAGTGQRTILAQIAAAELGVDVSSVSVHTMALHDAPVDLGAWSSRGTLMGGNAVKAAAGKAADTIRGLAATKLGVTPRDIRLANGAAHSHDASVDIGDLVEIAGETQDGVLRVEDYFTVEMAENNVSPAYSFAALAVEVFVDQSTGKVTVLDVVSVHDSGTVINPANFESQVVGGVAMGLGAALGEELIHEGGRLVNPAYSDYALPRAADMPNVRVIPIESVDPVGPHGAKGIGEISIVVTPAAVANAVAHATGKRIRDLPITPDKVLGAIAPISRSRYRIWNHPRVWWVAMIRWAYPRGLHAALRAAARRLARRSVTRPIEHIVTPTTVDAAVQTLQATDHRALAGGTDLMPARTQGLVRETHFVDLTEISELRRISDAAGDLVIGASVTLSELEAHAGANDDHALRAALASIASPQIRAMATVAGNLCQQKRCWFFRSGFDCYKRGGAACPCYAVLGDHRFYHAAMDAHRCQAVTPSDLGTVLIALDATIGLRSAQARRRLDAADLYSGPGEVALTTDEIIVDVRVPAAARRRVTRFEKLGLWTGDFAVASAATALEWDASGRISSARVVVGGIAPTPRRLPEVERTLVGARLESDNVATLLDRSRWDRRAHPLPGNAWKLQAAQGLMARCLESSLPPLPV